jgi:hypothetical protein
MVVRRVKLAQLFSDLDGTFATVKFRKQDGSERSMNLRFGVRKGVKGTGNAPSYNTYGVRAYDVKIGAFRTVNLRTVSEVKARGVRYIVMD